MLREKRRPVIAGNWKMNKTVPEATDLVRELREELAGLRERVEIIVAPSFPADASSGRMSLRDFGPLGAASILRRDG